MFDVTQSREERIKTIHEALVMLMLISKRRFAQRLQTFGLTYIQFFTLAALAAHKQACTMSDLTNVTFQDPPTMTGIVNRLVKMNLAERTRSETDRRVVLVQATPPGIDLINHIQESIKHNELTTYAAAFTDDDLIALERLLRDLLRIHLGQYMSLRDTDLEAEIEKLQRFMNDPINYVKMEDGKHG